MESLAKYVTRHIKVGASETEKKIPFIKNTRTVSDPHFVAREDLADGIAEVCNDLAEQGYEVISVFPTIGGVSKATTQSGYGYSVTDGAVITARLVEE